MSHNIKVIHLKTKKSRIIRVRDPQLRRFRAALRLVLRAAYSDQHVRLLGQFREIRKDPNLNSLEKEQMEKELYVKVSLLNEAYRKAPLGCGVCGTNAIEDDLKNSEYNHTWFCEICYNVNQEYYKKNPHPWLPSWRKLYP